MPVVILSEPPIKDSIVSTSPRGDWETDKVDGVARRCGDPAIVAEDDIVALAGVDRVAVSGGIRRHRARDITSHTDDHIGDNLAILTTDDDVVAVTRGDTVGSAVIRLGAPNPVDVHGVLVVARQRAGQRRGGIGINTARVGGGPVEVAGVAEDDVVGVRAQTTDVFVEVRHDHVGVDAAKDDVAADARGDLVGAADQGLDRLDQAERDRLGAEVWCILTGGRDLAMVAEHQIVAVACDDHIQPEATDDDVIERARRDVVVAAKLGICGDDAVNVVGQRVVARTEDVATAGVCSGPIEIAVVAKHNVVVVPSGGATDADVKLARVGDDVVVTEAAEDDVLVEAGRDGVVASACRVGSCDQAKGDREISEAREIRDSREDMAVVAEDQVAAATGVDDVANPTK